MPNTGRRTAAPSATGNAHAARTRASLISGAIESLHEVGFAGSSAREIARRAGCNQALIFYHFGSVTKLLLAALDEVSARRLMAYRQLVPERATTTLVELVAAARSIFVRDMEAGYVRVLVEMITGSQSVPELKEQVGRRLRPWRDVVAATVKDALPSSAAASLLPPEQLADGVMAAFLGLELLTAADGELAAAHALFDRAQLLAALFDRAGFGSVLTNPQEE